MRNKNRTKKKLIGDALLGGEGVINFYKTSRGWNILGGLDEYFTVHINQDEKPFAAIGVDKDGTVKTVTLFGKTDTESDYGKIILKQFFKFGLFYYGGPTKVRGSLRFLIDAFNEKYRKMTLKNK